MFHLCGLIGLNRSEDGRLVRPGDAGMFPLYRDPVRPAGRTEAPRRLAQRRPQPASTAEAEEGKRPSHVGSTGDRSSRVVAA
jgi:hypothetical protein